MLVKTIEIGEAMNSAAVLQAYLLDGCNPRGAVIICPGGGYIYTTDREGEPVAMQFAAAGFHAFVLRYSCAPSRYPQALRELTNAICLVRDHADEWKLDPRKIAVCGFSAGGHLAASLAVRYDAPELQDVERMAPGKNRPDAMILGYPVLSGGMEDDCGLNCFQTLTGEPVDGETFQKLSLIEQVNGQTPPAFLWHTDTDELVNAAYTLQMASALHRNHVPLELHLFPEGPHGLSLATSEMNANGSAHIAHWMELCLEWLRGRFGVDPYRCEAPNVVTKR